MKIKKLTSAILASLLLTTSFACVQSDAVKQADNTPKKSNIVAQAATENANAEKPIVEDEAASSEMLSAPLSEYHDKTVNGHKTCTYEVVEFEGKTAFKIIPDPTYTDTKTLAIDGYHYKGVGVDLSKCTWIGVEYYYDTAEPGEFVPQIGVMKSGVLTKGIYSNAADNTPLSAGAWNVAMFDISDAGKNIDPNATEYIMNQLHIYPFGDGTLSKLKATDVIYIGNILFFNEKPEEFVNHTAYMKGYEDGTFKPGGTMTRAEACTVIARLMAGGDDKVAEATATAFTDVATNAWYAKYIAACEKAGLLKAYSGTFAPDQNITRAEFVELVFNLGLLSDAGKNGTFTDVAQDHPRAAVIAAAGKSGLVNGYDNGDGTFSFKPDATITRAEVVTVINRANGVDKTSDDILPSISILFTDVDYTHWAFANIAEATVDHAESGTVWASVKADPVIALEKAVGLEKLYNTAEGNAKVAELDELEAKRIEEIKNTPNTDYSGITGKKIYVSPDGNDENDGLTENTAIKSFTAANKKAVSGDVVLLQRGGTWHERLNAKSGVTYSAYGEGAKPVLNGSIPEAGNPENWALVHEDKATGALIWKYKDMTLLDIGTIVFNDGEAYAYKEIPYSKLKEFVLASDTSKTFDWKTQLDRNLEFFHAANSAVSGAVISSDIAMGPIYLRCDNGNPGKVFNKIDFVTRGPMVRVGTNNDVTVDNIAFMYSSFGISAGTQKNLTVTNCTFEWIGGNMQYYKETGQPVRYGNAIEVYGGCDNYVVDNCYFNEIYDAAVTHQVGGQSTDLRMDNIRYSNNVMTNCQYSIEYFFNTNVTTIVHEGKNVLFTGNLMRRAGYGFGSTRPNLETQRHIRSGFSTQGKQANLFDNFVIENNIFDRSVYELSQTETSDATKVPVYSGNTYIQGIGNKLFSHGKGIIANSNIAAKHAIETILGDTTAQIYFVDYIPPYEFGFEIEKKAPVSDDDYKDWADDVLAEVEVDKGEVKDPLYIVSAKDNGTKIYADIPKATMAAKVMSDDGTYVHFTFVEGGENTVHLDCYSLPDVPVENSEIVIKMLMRSNCSGYSGTSVYHLYDSDGTKITGYYPQASSDVEFKGDGTWQEIYLRVTNFPENIHHTKQVHLYPLGASVKGTPKPVNSGETPYIDVAAWGIFPNLASAEAYEFAK